jgi:membrane protease YdiL (CAAX protease family)
MKFDPEMTTAKTDLRAFAILSIIIILISKIASYTILSKHQDLSLSLDFYLNTHSIIFSWTLPILVVLLIEKRHLTSIGLTLGVLPNSIYVVLVAVILALPAIFLRQVQTIMLEIIEQILFIAFAEEILWRGYLQKRLSDWMGSHIGIVLSAVLFGLGHLVSIHAVEGYLLPLDSLVTLVQTTIGGLIFGYLLHWSKSIWPGSLLHLFGNVLFSQLNLHF